ncbi:enoyl-CoA hydratase/isomerase family protein [Novosphingobium sp. BL-52-GroH]|uniref:enoyl-CoA hydratase/isomerase family protein n=1 Tax=Novosphingobium sp. BL-52-GroH TaxID=3349877 RepID=UPI00384F6339
MIEIDKRDGGIVVLTLARPQAANALTLPMVAQLRATIARLDADPDVSVLVLAAQGKAFCAGLDLKEVLLGEDAPQGPIENMDLQERFAGLMRDVVAARFPVVAAIGGAAVGAGMGLALAADIRVAGPGAKFLVGAVKVALSAGECGISYHLPRLVGGGRAYELMLTGRPVDAAEARAIGLATTLADEGDLLEAALAVAALVAENSPYAIRHTKRIMRTNIDAPSLDAAIELENHVQCLALGTQDFKEACRAFAERRKPNFTGA